MQKTERLEERSCFIVDVPARRPLSRLSDLLRRLPSVLGISTAVTCPRCGFKMERVGDRVTYWDSFVVCGALVWRCPVCDEKKETPRAFFIAE